MPMRVQSKVLVCVQLTLLQPDVNKYAKRIHFKNIYKYLFLLHNKTYYKNIIYIYLYKLAYIMQSNHIKEGYVVLINYE